MLPLCADDGVKVYAVHATFGLAIHAPTFALVSGTSQRGEGDTGKYLNSNNQSNLEQAQLHTPDACSREKTANSYCL